MRERKELNEVYRMRVVGARFDEQKRSTLFIFPILIQSSQDLWIVLRSWQKKEKLSRTYENVFYVSVGYPMRLIFGPPLQRFSQHLFGFVQVEIAGS
jgi:hypothetical protein